MTCGVRVVRWRVVNDVWGDSGHVNQTASKKGTCSAGSFSGPVGLFFWLSSFACFFFGHVLMGFVSSKNPCPIPPHNLALFFLFATGHVEWRSDGCEQNFLLCLHHILLIEDCLAFFFRLLLRPRKWIGKSLLQLRETNHCAISNFLREYIIFRYWAYKPPLVMMTFKPVVTVFYRFLSSQTTE